MLPVFSACVWVGPPLLAKVALTLVGLAIRPGQMESAERLLSPMKVAPPVPAVQSRMVPPALCGLLAMMLPDRTMSAPEVAWITPVVLLPVELSCPEKVLKAIFTLLSPKPRMASAPLLTLALLALKVLLVIGVVLMNAASDHKSNAPALAPVLPAKVEVWMTLLWVAKART